MYGGAVSGTAINPAARYGIDWRQVAFASSNGAVIQTPGFSVSPTGAVGATSLTTSSIVQAQVATLTGATIESPGVYMAFPSFTVQAPPSGTTATVSVATGIVTAAVNFGATGKGYAADDVPTATLPGAAGRFQPSSCKAWMQTAASPCSRRRLPARSRPRRSTGRSA